LDSLLVFSAQAIFGAGAQFLGGYLSDKFSLIAPYIAMSLIFILATIIAFFELGFKRDVLIKKSVERKGVFLV